jgi:transcriptional regulator with GAF, ATPase, and Fis domain
VVHSPDQAALNRRLTLNATETLAVGRGAEDPRGILLDTRLSRTHARFAFDAERARFRVTDAGSRNGTFVDGARVETALLDRDSVVRLGESVLVFDENTRMAELERDVARVAAGTLSVLILGETGSGKELLARQVHERSGRSGAFVAINCAALPKEMIAAELFGHTRGAFSGANRDRTGLFRSADGGTLLLDEIGDMPLELQPTLLRVLQERRVRPLGADQETAVDVRVVAATHQDLDEMLASGAFRADLFARLAQLTLRLPPLRQRRAELVGLAGLLARQHGRELSLSAEAAEALLLWRWPLNFRELDALLARFVQSGAPEGRLDLEFLRRAKPELLRASAGPAPASEAPGASEARAASESTRDVDALQLTRALEEAGGNLAVAARKLGVSRQKLYRWMERAGVEAKTFRRGFVDPSSDSGDD